MSYNKSVGCTIEEFKQHLESKFQPGMSWNNHGIVWHIDEIKPCAAFDLSDPNQFKQCFHYLNAQPLFKVDNLKKGAKYNGINYKSIKVTR